MKTKNIRCFIFYLLSSVLAGFVYAQDSLVGTYTSSFQAANSSKTNGVRLVIASVENGVVKGVVTRYQKTCDGDYVMEGEQNGNILIINAVERGGRAEECSFGLKVAQEGNKLVGTTHKGQPIQLSK